jgi:predicted DNA-binding transcriptional regulator AlpA
MTNIAADKTDVIAKSRHGAADAIVAKADAIKTVVWNGTRLYRRRDLTQILPVSATQIDEWIAAGTFPPPIIMPGGAIRVWPDHTIQKWIEDFEAAAAAEAEKPKPVKVPRVPR